MKRIVAIVVAASVLSALLGAAYLLGARRAAESRAVSAPAQREVLYWYDPMRPDQHFDKPGKSPFMDMQLVPKYADEAPARQRRILYWYDPMAPQQHFDKPGKSPAMPSMDLLPKYADEIGEAGAVRVDPAVVQNLGVRTQVVRVGRLDRTLRVPASVAWDLREASAVSARVDAVIERLYVRAPFDAVRKGQSLAALLAPQWSAAAAEYLALADAQSADGRALRAAARQRLRALGLGEDDIAALRPGDPRVVVRAPADGVVAELSVREGERVNAGMPLLRINGLDRVWLEAAVPQAEVAGIAAGTPASATVDALPGERFDGRVESVLPDVDAQTRTQRVRIALDNPRHRLAPGMFAELRLQATAGAAHPLVPDDALIATGDEARVVLAEGDGRFRVVRVRVGRSAGGMTEVLDGLAGGERVVVSGQFLIDSEASLSGALQRLRNGDDSGAPSDDTSGSGAPSSDASESGGAAQPAAPAPPHPDPLPDGEREKASTPVLPVGTRGKSMAPVSIPSPQRGEGLGEGDAPPGAHATHAASAARADRTAHAAPADHAEPRP